MISRLETNSSQYDKVDVNFGHNIHVFEDRLCFTVVSAK